MRRVALLALLFPSAAFAFASTANAASPQDVGGTNREDSANCVVADPSTTPLNIRTTSNGKIVGTIANGERTRILDQATDRTGDEWVYISDSSSQPIGWVFRRYIVCR